MEPLVDSSSKNAPGRNWPFITRICFRIAFCYFILYTFCDGSVLILRPIDRIPIINDAISYFLWLPFSKLTENVGIRVFHLHGIAATWHGGGSGDTALNWISALVYLVIAVAVALIWSVLDRKRTEYPVLYAWLRFIVRLTVGVAMISYGLIKVFPLQMQPPTLGVLNEPFGQVSPNSLLWSMLGAFPAYERICGLVEVIAGVLLLIRRTALAGALLTIFVMTNVLLYNLFFDVPVKLFAAHLVIFGLFLVLPDVGQLTNLFILNKPAEPQGIWLPPIKKARTLKVMRIVEVCYLVLTLISLGSLNNTRWNIFLSAQGPSPLLGSWVVRSASPSSMVTAEGCAWTNIYFDNTFRAMVRDTSGQLWRYPLRYDPRKQTVGMRGILDDTVFSWKVIDADHMKLVSIRKSQVSDLGRIVKLVPGPPETLQLERQPTPQRYFLYDRGFHLVSEWGYEH